MAVRLDSIADESTRLDSIEKPIRLDSVKPPDDPFDTFTRKYPSAWSGVGLSGEYVNRMYPKLSKTISDKIDEPLADFIMKSVANGVKEQEIITALDTGSLKDAAVYLDKQKQIRTGRLDDISQPQPEPLKIPPGPNITDQARYWEAFVGKTDPTISAAYIELQQKGIDKPLRKVLGGIAYTETKLATGLLLHTPELLFGPDLAERIHKGIAKYEVGAEAKTVGDFVEFVGGLKTAGWLMRPLVGLMGAGEVITQTTGGGATFMLRNLSEQTVDRIKKGEPISGKELFVETLIGAAFGLAGATIAKFKDTIGWLKSAARSPAGKRVPLRLWLRGEESARAFSRPGMTQKKWDKLYKDDMERLGKSFYDAHAAETLRQVPRLTGEVGGEAARVSEGGLVAPIKRTVAPNRKLLAKGIRHRVVKMTPEEVAEEAAMHETMQDILGVKPHRVKAVYDVVSDRLDLLKKVQLGILTQEEADIITRHAAKEAQVNDGGLVSKRLPAAPTRKLLAPSEIAKVINAVDKAVVAKDGKALESIYFGLIGKPLGGATVQERGKPEYLVNLVGHIHNVLTNPYYAEDRIPPALDAMKPEPHLFQPTQLMKRVPTPGIIQPPRRVLVPQPTALATVKRWERIKREVGPSGKPLEMPRNPIVRWSLDYMQTRNSDIERIYGFDPGFVPKDPSFVRRRGEILKTMAKQQEKYASRYQKKLDSGIEPRNINALSALPSARYMWMQIDDRYGVPVWLTATHMYNEVGLGVFEADAAVRETIQARHLVSITRIDDDKIGEWLDSNDTRRNILAKDMSPDSLMLAAKEDDLLQGKLAHEMKMMIAGRWIDTGDMPSDIKKFVPVAKEWQTAASNKNYIASVLRDAKAADDAGTLLEHVTNVEPWKSGLGVRKNYYMSSPDDSDVIDDTMYKMGIGVFEAPPDKANLPGTYSYEAKPRRGKPKRKGGSTLNNIYNKYTRVAAMNRARKDMRIISDRLRYVQMSASDKSSLNLMLNNMLRKGTIPKRGFALPIKIKRVYWTTSFSPFVRPGTAIYRIVRNAPQNIAFGPFGISMPKALKHAAILTKNRGKLHEFDPEMMSRYDRNFQANVSQRKAMWTEFYMQDIAKITKDFDKRALTNKAIGILEWSGTGYMAVDEFSRNVIWITEYQIVKEAMNDFLNGKINQNQFYNITKLDTVHRQQQLLVHDMVSNGRVDDMAELAADWLTDDVNFRYKTESRSLMEQSPEERVFFGPMTFNRGRIEHGYYRGVRAFLDGMSERNYGKAYRGATNILKGITSSTLVSIALSVATGKKAYDIGSQFTFGLLDPGTSKFHDAAQQTGYNMYRYSKGEQGLLSTIDNIADAWATVGESLFIPYSIEMTNIHESVNDKAGVTLYRMLRNGVAAKLCIDVKEFSDVSRTRRQAIVHALWGTEEYPKKETGAKVKPAKAKKKKKG